MRRIHFQKHTDDDLLKVANHIPRDVNPVISLPIGPDNNNKPKQACVNLNLNPEM
jgi:hypothetical protein